MAWISVHESAIGGKLRELAKEINATEEEALGILVKLWLWGLENADINGKIRKADKEDILDAFSLKLVKKSGFEGLIDALVDTRWLDILGDGVYAIHDWEVWQEQWYKAKERRENDAKRKRESRSRHSVVKTAAEADGHTDIPTDAPKDGGSENEGEPPGDEPKVPEEPKYAPAFEQFWSVYPRKIGKAEGYKKYKARRNDGFSDAQLIEAATEYSKQCKKMKTDKQYIKHPKTFLSDNCPFIDFLPKKPTQPEPEDGQRQNPFGEWGGS